MNLLVVVEGKVEKKVYKHWISFINPNLTNVEHISKIENNNFTIVSGKGYPRYYEIIDSAIADINQYNNINRLIISIDSELLSSTEKLAEVQNFLADRKCSAEIKIIIQHFCFETWALGNKRIGPRNPAKDSDIYDYKNIFDVRIKDPELLPEYEEVQLNRAQFAYRYLVALLKDKNINYSKNNPNGVYKKHYFEGVKRRFDIDNHIKSFNSFLKAFN